MAKCPKLKLPENTPPLVLIEWEDSAQPVSEWRYLDDLGSLSVVRCLSVGFLVHDGKRVKVLAPNVGEIGTEHAQASGVFRIPSRCVLRVITLKAGR
jgi:hypothetical protein